MTRKKISEYVPNIKHAFVDRALASNGKKLGVAETKKEELLKAVRVLKSGAPLELPRIVGAARSDAPAVSQPPPAPVSSPVTAATPPPPPRPPTPDSGVSAARKAILDDPKLNSMLDAFPGSGVTVIRDGG